MVEHISSPYQQLIFTRKLFLIVASPLLKTQNFLLHIDVRVFSTNWRVWFITSRATIKLEATIISNFGLKSMRVFLTRLRRTNVISKKVYCVRIKFCLRFSFCCVWLILFSERNLGPHPFHAPLLEISPSTVFALVEFHSIILWYPWNMDMLFYGLFIYPHLKLSSHSWKNKHMRIHVQKQLKQALLLALLKKESSFLWSDLDEEKELSYEVCDMEDYALEIRNYPAVMTKPDLADVCAVMTLLTKLRRNTYQ